MKDIGNQLKEAREKRNLSIQDAAIATKINIKIIKSIESGDIESLPAKPFLRGFVQSYAKYLDLDTNEIMKKFLEIQGSTKPKPQITENLASSQASHEEVQNKFEFYKKIAYGIAALVAIFFVYYIQKLVSKYEQESKTAKEQHDVVVSQIQPEEKMLPPEEKISSQDKKSEPLLELKKEPNDPAISSPTKNLPEIKATAEQRSIEKKPDEKKLDEKKSEPTSMPTHTEVKPNQPIEKPPAAIIVSPTPVPGIVKKLAPPAQPKIAAPSIPEIAPPIAPSPRSQYLIIEALDNVEVRFSKDGESEKTVKLKPEQFLTIKANSKINLNINDSGAVNIIHNGRDQGVPGSLGQPKKINYQ